MKVLLIQPPSADPMSDRIFMFEPLARGDCRRRRGARDRCPLPPGKQSIWACDAVVEPDRITHALSGDRPSMITSGPPRAWATSVTSTSVKCAFIRATYAGVGAALQMVSTPSGDSTRAAARSPAFAYSHSLPGDTSHSGPLSTSRQIASSERAGALASQWTASISWVRTRGSRRASPFTGANGPRFHRSTAGSRSRTCTSPTPL